MTKWCFTIDEYCSMMMDQSIKIVKVTESGNHWLVQYEYRY